MGECEGDKAVGVAAGLRGRRITGSARDASLVRSVGFERCSDSFLFLDISLRGFTPSRGSADGGEGGHRRGLGEGRIEGSALYGKR